MASSEVYWDHRILLPRLAPVQAKVTVALVALLCFMNSYDGEFVFDDSEAIVNNKVFYYLFRFCRPQHQQSDVLHVLLLRASV